jgi:hypothetical protein
MRLSRRARTRLECETLEDRVTPATLTWTGTVDGLWSHPGNWTTTVVTHPVPQNGDAIVLPQGAANTLQRDDLGLITLGSITFNDEGYTINGAGLILASGITVNPVASGVDTINNDVTFSGDQTVSLTHSQNAVAALVFTGNVDVASGTLVVAGPTGIGGGFYLSASYVFPPPMTLAVSTAGTMRVEPNAAVVTSQTTFHVLSDAGLDVSGAFANLAGTTFLVDGVLTTEPGSGLYNAGTLSFTAYGRLGGQVYVGGVFTNDSGGSMTCEGLLLIESGASFYSAGSAVVQTGELYSAGVTIVESGSTLLGNGEGIFVVPRGGELYVAGTFNDFFGSELYVYGLGIVASGGAIDVSGAYLIVAYGGALYDYGSVTINTNAVGTSSTLDIWGIFVIEPSSQLQDNSQVVNESTGVLYNFGSFTVAPGASFVNHGRIVGSGM